MISFKQIQNIWLSPTTLLCWLPPTVLGAILRFWSLGFGLPNHFRPDEDMVVLPSLGMVGGNLDPHDYTYPALYKYLLALIYRVCMALGLGAEGYTSVWEYAAYGFFVDGSFFFLVARGVSAVFGVLAIVAVYRVGELAYGRWVGGVSAWLLSVSVLHVRDSHFGVTDMTSASLLLIALVYCVHIAQRGLVKDYVFAGVLVGLATAVKYGAVLGLVPLGVAHLVRCPDNVPMLSRWLWDRWVWIGGVVCVLTFLVLSPYHVLNAAGFVRDFGFQMRHVFEYGHGADLGIGFLYHPQVSLRYGLGVLVLLGGVVGLVLMSVRRMPVDWVLLSLFVAFFIVVGRGRVVFFRYVLPLLPLLCVFCAVCIDRVRRLNVVPKSYVQVVGVVLVVLCVFEPLFASVRLNVMLGRDDTRAQARQWIEENIPPGVKLANVGGLYGDVQVKNRRGVGWWLVRFYNAFEDVPEQDLVTFLKRSEAQQPPFYLYHYNVGNTDLGDRSKGTVNLLSDPDLAVFVTHEHPLHYSDVDAGFMNALKARASLWGEFAPGTSGTLDVAVFDQQDAFYYPIGHFGDLERGGPTIKIWRVHGRDGVALANPGAPQKLVYDAFFWLGHSDLAIKNYTDAVAYYRRAIHTNPIAADVRIFMAIALMGQQRYSAAGEEVQIAFSLGGDIDLWERAMSFVGQLDRDAYAQMGEVCTSLGFHKEAVLVYERAMKYESVDMLNKLGLLYQTLNRFDDAVVVLRRALQLDPANTETQQILQRIQGR